MEVKRNETIEYRPTLVADSEYKMTRLVQQSGGDSVPINASNNSATIELPAVCMNLAKSYLNFTINVPAPGGTNVAFLYRDTPPISRLELFTRSGKYLCDISNFSNIYQAFGQRTKKIESFHGSDTGVVVKTGLNDLETKRITIPAATTAITDTFRIPGSELYNTVLSLDKSMYFGEVLQLRITFQNHEGAAFFADNAAGLNPVAAAGTTITGLNYFLAQEQNPRVVNDLVQTVSTEGMTVVVPFVHSYKTTATAADTAVSIRLSRGHGQSVERIYTIPINGAEVGVSRYVANAGALVSFYSLLNSKRLQEFDVLCGTTKDYDWLRAHEKKDRVVSLSEAENDTKNFAWSDSWCDGLECAKDQKLGGLDLSVEQKYDIYFKAGGTATKYYTAVVCQKMLSMGPGGVDIM